MKAFYLRAKIGGRFLDKAGRLANCLSADILFSRMLCRICGNGANNVPLTIREMQIGLRENFSYFSCAVCECIQIDSIPGDMSRYYPSDYYSFDSEEGKEFLNNELGFYKKLQAEYLTGSNRSIFGKMASLGYIPPRVYHWIRIMQLKQHQHILDIGCGAGLTLKRMFQLGFTHLTGVDPFIRSDYHYADHFHIYKKDPLQLDETVQYDCIMMHHSFEHMEMEEATLIKIRKLLKPGGKILIRIPVVSKELMTVFNTDLVSLDAPRHFYIHTPESMAILCEKAGLKIDHTEYDADASSFWASEQYKNDIPLMDEKSYGKNREASLFTKNQIRNYKKEIGHLNAAHASDTAAFYISSEKSLHEN
jgi:SAM-dependent methyltransferase